MKQAPEHTPYASRLSSKSGASGIFKNDESSARSSLDELSFSKDPQCLFVVARYLPVHITFARHDETDLIEEEAELGSLVRHRHLLVSSQSPPRNFIWENAITTHSEDITDVEKKGLWRFELGPNKLSFRDRFRDALSSQSDCFVVGDPSVDLGKIVTPVEAILRLRRRLDAFLLQHGMIPVWLTEQAANERYSDDLLFPLFHYRTPPVGTGFIYLDWPGYIALNREFATTLRRVASEYNHHWFVICNYNLMCLPSILREFPSLEESLIYFYTTTVFPSSEMYRILPERAELLQSLLAADVVGFHSPQYK